MPRFLSPAKICLILLIDVYHHREAQDSDAIPLLSFVSQHVLRRNEAWKTSNGSATSPQILALEDFRTLLSPLTSNLPGRSLYDVFLKYLWRLASFDELDGLFEQSRAPDAQAISQALPISSASPIGQFLRRCRLEFVRLQFSDAQQLWEDLLIFREPSWSTWASRNPDEASMQDKGGIFHAGHLSPILIDRQQKRRSDGHEKLPSQDLLEVAVRFQLEQIQGTGCRLPPEMQEQMAAMIEHAGTRPADVHFINFFNSWRSGAYSDAVDNLHRYFDYAIEGYGTHQAVKTYHQYALLHLAVLHADFGCYDDAVSAMDECIATARENQDSRCLNFGLSWLVHLRKAHPEYVKQERLVQSTAFAGSDSDILFFLQQKALETKDWTQLSSALLSQAEAIGQSLNKAYDYSYQANHLNITHALHSLQPTQVRLHGSLHNQSGMHALATLQAAVLAKIYERKATRPEIVSMHCIQAYQLAVKGSHELAMQTLRDCDPLRLKTIRMQNLHLGIANMVRLRQALYRNEMIAAERLMRMIKPLRNMAEPDIAFETHVLELEYLQKANRVPDAFEKVNYMLEELKRTSGSAYVYRVRLLTIKANLWAHVGRPTKGFSLALRVANAGFVRNLTPHVNQGVAALATILVDLEEYSAAKQMVESVLPRAIEGIDACLVARLYTILTDALVGQATLNYLPGSRDSDQQLNHALIYLDRAREAYAQLQHHDGTLECLQKKAMLFRYRGEETVAEEMEGMYAAVLEEGRKREREARGVK
ncbi:hypothetical protein CAC42_7531 [Sphaceloma murrayae]|uniref:Anaphase-promoting complex subunit 5 n=1 Tax=Sphaceloma murrayae TaxID=2082308 RepID=A0A2K1QXB1_9PEZI|nr:hypothetical protein CAC42_7531 [Sphaceloma murrayae]